LSREFMREVYFSLDAHGDTQVQTNGFMKSFAAKWPSMAAPVVASGGGEAGSSRSVSERGDAGAGGGGLGAAGSRPSLTSWTNGSSLDCMIF
jgi:hypothetical protein